MMGSSSDYRLIELIRQNKHLFDQRDPDFRNLEKKEITWQAIAAAQGSTPEICRRRFRSLRDRFARERRQRKKELLDGTNPNPIWQKMLFLSPHLRTRKRFNWSRPHKRDGDIAVQNVYSIVPVDSSGAPVTNHPVTSYILVNSADGNSSAYLGLNPTAAGAQESPSEVVAEHHESSEIQESQEAVAEASSDAAEEVTSDGAERVSQGVAEEPSDVVEQASPGVEQEAPPGDVEPEPPEAAAKPERPKIASVFFQGAPKRGLMGKMRLRSRVVAAGRPRKKARTAAVSRDLRVSPARDPGVPQSPAKDAADSSCNAAFCTVVKNYLDKISNPMRLSSARIKILSMVHDEMYTTN